MPVTPKSILRDAWGIDVSSLVPDDYGEYRLLVEDAIVFFLENLSDERVEEIVAEQQTLRSDAGMSERLTTLMGSCPTLHKLAQVVARDRRLSATLRERLQVLEFTKSTMSVAQVLPVIRRELGRDTLNALRLDSCVLAQASVAAVVPFSVPDAQSGGVSDGVLKVLKPGIEERLDEELAIWSRLGVFIDERCAHYGLPTLRYSDTIEAVRDLLSNEVRLDGEQEHLRQAARFYADSPKVHIPALLPFGTPRITAMERIYGKKVTDVAQAPEGVRKSLAGTIIESLIAEPVWSADRDVLFHADPHAGNLFVTDAGKLSVLDWSLVGRLRKTERVLTAQLMLGALALDASRVARSLEMLANEVSDQRAVRAVVDRSVAQLYRHRAPGFRWLLDLLDSAMFSGAISFGQDLVLFRKSVLTLEGVVADVSAQTSLDRVLPASAVRQFLREGASRALAAPLSRDFGTHVSNLDLLWLYWSIPRGVARYWANRWIENNAPDSG